MGRLGDWWDDGGQLWYAAVALFVLVAAVPLGIYGVHEFLRTNWLVTIVCILNAVIAMYFLAHAAPLASVGTLGVAVVLWLYNLALLFTLIGAAVFGGYILVAKLS